MEAYYNEEASVVRNFLIFDPETKNWLISQPLHAGTSLNRFFFLPAYQWQILEWLKNDTTEQASVVLYINSENSSPFSKANNNDEMPSL